ncbi:hypothetical protein NPIL_187161 [Nephila pilipes]|uniref:Uncharacterized protein n=1 Tax=Nephila pilipes TaxID=299642 RepID=A0A8X6P891_NEPPI|nr:hypothetical protein NPIL_187161 [Nephila pilipes]
MAPQSIRPGAEASPRVSCGRPLTTGQSQGDLTISPKASFCGTQLCRSSGGNPSPQVLLMSLLCPLHVAYDKSGVIKVLLWGQRHPVGGLYGVS